MAKTEIVFTECSDAIIEEIMNLTKQALITSADMMVDDTRKKIRSHTGQLADGVVRESDDNIYVNMDNGWASIHFGYLSQASFKQVVRRKTFYPNPYWIEFGGVEPHVIQTRQLKNDENLTYQLTDLNGQQYGYVVTNPGSQPKNYMRDACREDARKVQTQFVKDLGEIEKLEKSLIKTGKIKKWRN